MRGKKPERNISSGIVRAWLRRLLSPQHPRVVPEGIDAWERCFETAVDEGVAGLLYPLFSTDSDIPGHIKDLFRGEHERCLAGRELYLRHLLDLRAALPPSSPDPVLCQGIALSETVYGAAYTRQLGDVDLLIDERRFEEMCEACAACGFNRLDRYAGVWRKNGCCVDLHTNYWGADRIGARGRSVSAAAITTVPLQSLRGYSVPVFPLLATGALLHSVKHGFSRMLWDFDLLLLMNRGAFTGVYPSREERYYTTLARYHLFRSGLIDTAPPATALGLPLPMVDHILSFSHTRGTGELLIALAGGTVRSFATYLAASLFPSRTVLRQMYGDARYPLLIVKRLAALTRLCAEVHS
jgi:hypothetical protein